MDVHSEKSIQCKECQNMFPTIGRLNFHKSMVHVSKSYKCDQCDFGSKRKGDLKRHIVELKKISTQNFRQKSKYLPNISIFPKNYNFRQKIKIFAKKSKFFPKNQNFRHKLELSPKINIFAKNLNFRLILECSPNFRY